MNNFCKDLEFTTAVNTLAVAIANQCSSEKELAVVAAVFSQIGYTIEAIAANRSLCNSIKNINSSQ